MLKFRSMHAVVEPVVLPDLPHDTAPGGVEGDDRRTRFGTFLRRTSLDELPQLLNVLNGDMSLIGPRPERPDFVELFERKVHRYRDRHRVKSGITGWAQVNGLRGKTSLNDRVEWENYYIENWSLWLDVKILLMTIWAIRRHFALAESAESALGTPGEPIFATPPPRDSAAPAKIPKGRVDDRRQRIESLRRQEGCAGTPQLVRADVSDAEVKPELRRSRLLLDGSCERDRRRPRGRRPHGLRLVGGNRERIEAPRPVQLG
jgi:Bacterial sugar transferase